MSQSWTWPPVVLSDGAVKGMKWLGLFLMTADHAQKYGLMLAVPGVYEAGRVAFPLFAIALAYNLARVPGHNRALYVRVLTRLLCCGALAVAVGIMYVIEARRPFWKTRAAVVFLLGGALVEFWWPGAALCVGAWWYCRQPNWGALLLWLAGTACLTLINANWWACASFGVQHSEPLMSVNHRSES